MNAVTETRRIARFPKHSFSSDGRVISYTRKKPFVMRGMPVGRYLAVELQLGGGKRERIYVHRAIAEAFHGPCPEGMHCRHLDGNPRNNKPGNLAWGTPAENNADKIIHGTATVGERNPHSKLTSSCVLRMRQIRRATGISYSKLAREFNVSTMTAYRAVTKQSWGQV